MRYIWCCMYVIGTPALLAVEFIFCFALLIFYFFNFQSTSKSKFLWIRSWKILSRSRDLVKNKHQQVQMGLDIPHQSAALSILPRTKNILLKD